MPIIAWNKLQFIYMPKLHTGPAHDFSIALNLLDLNSRSVVFGSSKFMSLVVDMHS